MVGKGARVILALFLLAAYFLYGTRRNIIPYFRACEWNERAQFLDKLFYPFLEACSTCNVTYWLEYGGVLGAYRNGKLIPWDKDLDAGVLVERPNGTEISPIDIRKLTCVQKLLPRGTEQSWLLKHSGSFKLWRKDISGELDVQLWYHDGSRLTMALGRTHRGLELKLHVWQLESEIILPVIPMAFEGRFINVPHKTFEYLSMQYPFTVPYGIELPYKPACWVKFHPFKFCVVLLGVLAACVLCVRRWRMRDVKVKIDF